MEKKIIIIGGGAAGPKAAAKLKRLNKQYKIIIYTDEDVVSYSACGLPYYIEGIIPNIENLIVRTPDAFRVSGIEVYLKKRCIEIIPENKIIKILDIDTNQVEEDNYDTLIIATGARPYIPKIQNLDLKNIFTLRNLDDADEIRQKMLSSNTATIIGGGYIGIELLEAFVKNNLHVNIIERNDNILHLLDNDILSLIREHIEVNYSKYVTFYTNETAVEFKGNYNVQATVTQSGKVIPSDFVVICSGVLPNSEVFHKAGGKLSTHNSIDVNSKMETSIENIYAAGDCAVKHDIITGRKIWIPLGSTANKEGRVCALNIHGEESHFDGILGALVTKFFNFTISSVGLSEKEAKSLNYTTISALVTKRDRAGYMPDANNISIKLIVDKETRKVLGAQAIGQGEAHKRINTVASVILAQLKVEDILNLDLPYAPPYSPAIDPILTAAQIVFDKCTNKTG